MFARVATPTNPMSNLSPMDGRRSGGDRRCRVSGRNAVPCDPKRFLAGVECSGHHLAVRRLTVRKGKCPATSDEEGEGVAAMASEEALVREIRRSSGANTHSRFTEDPQSRLSESVSGSTSIDEFLIGYQVSVTFCSPPGFVWIEAALTGQVEGELLHRQDRQDGRWRSRA